MCCNRPRPWSGWATSLMRVIGVQASSGNQIREARHKAGLRTFVVATYRARACPVDHGTGWRSQILIEATSTVPRQTKSRLSYRVATARCWRSWQKARSTVLRCL